MADISIILEFIGGIWLGIFSFLLSSSFWISALLIIAIILISVGFHEYGHYIAAKYFGVKVEEFAIGIGPKLFSKQKGETLFSLRAFPIGGYCKMLGESNEGDDSKTDMRRSLYAQTPWARFVILLSGPAMNILLAGVFITIGLFFHLVPSFHYNGYLLPTPVNVSQEVDNNIDKLSLETHKTMYALWQSNMQGIGMAVEQVKEKIASNFETPSAPSSPSLEKTLVPISENEKVDLSKTEMLVGSPVVVGKTIYKSIDEFPVLPIFFLFMIFMNMSLAVFNLLPFPGLDGFQAYLCAFEYYGLKLPVHMARVVNTVGVFILFGFGITMIFYDLFMRN